MPLFPIRYFPMLSYPRPPAPSSLWPAAVLLAGGIWERWQFPLPVSRVYPKVGDWKSSDGVTPCTVFFEDAHKRKNMAFIPKTKM
ncbi:hypothetical protein E2562_008311 [Oryza meyeriana var. granulata]|uniref:Uncharacterized protein n=1 Tax=Oryza meyeriana var. granulata TaxID=110450 RepID=A0A6G1DG15_9ORYZ|nr:hypothetical protein E2562_008311 [Oryza meyeriana var. granulata]